MIQRSLGHYERYSLARHNVSHAPAVVFTALIPSVSLNSPDRLLSAIRTLLDTEPLLSSSVADSRTEDPKFKLHTGIDPKRVLVEMDSEEEGRDSLLRGIEIMTGLDIEQAPLWRVFQYPIRDGYGRISVATHHVICDGSSARNLFLKFITLLLDSNHNGLPSSNEIPFPPSLESTVDVKPSKLYLLRTLFSTFLAPRLPSFLYTPPTPFWPNPARESPWNETTGLRIFFLPQDLSTALATVSKSHQTPTLQPVFTTAATCAIAITVLRRRSEKDNSPLRIVSQSPVSLRSPSLGHTSLCTGNYVSSISHSSPAPITPSYLSSTRFWSSTREYSDHLKSPSSHQRAKEGMGLLAYLPTGMAETQDAQGRDRTEWEQFFEDQMKSENPWRGGSFEVSNLGRMNIETGGALEGVKEVCWAQPGSGAGVGIAFNTVSFGGQLSCALSWRLNTTETEVVEEIFEAYEQILRRIAKGEITEETTIFELLPE
ncbi:uncharacterized protein JCM6883_005406 [Sporobolomyces salmoneus]|uniref:uncharacterized protein n=1 Tax=Sporobolomyces salmoneus TaxID=183962 RepID=UPI00316D026C